MPEVSIIMPVYNVEKFISKAIRSVLNQTFQNFELLIIIDGSPDNSIDIAKGYNDERIRIYEKINGGLSDARNYGLEKASGDFILFLDSDDWINPSLIADNLVLIKEKISDVLVFGYNQDNEDSNGNVTSSVAYAPQIEILRKSEVNELNMFHLGILGYAWNKLYRRSFLEKHNLRFEKGTSLIEDILFNVQVYRLSSHILFNPNTYYHYINREVETLMKKFYRDVYSLKKRRAMVLRPFLNEYNITNGDSIVAASHVRGIKYAIYSLFHFQNELNLWERKEYIDDMYKDPITIEYIEKFIPSNFVEVLYKFLIKNKLSFLTTLINFIKK